LLEKHFAKDLFFLCELKSPLQNDQAWNFGLSSAIMKNNFTHKLYASKKVCNEDLPYKGQNQVGVEMLNWEQNWFFATNIVPKTVSILVIWFV